MVHKRGISSIMIVNCVTSSGFHKKQKKGIPVEIKIEINGRAERKMEKLKRQLIDIVNEKKDIIIFENDRALETKTDQFNQKYHRSHIGGRKHKKDPFRRR